VDVSKEVRIEQERDVLFETNREMFVGRER